MRSRTGWPHGGPVKQAICDCGASLDLVFNSGRLGADRLDHPGDPFLMRKGEIPELL